MPIIAQLGYNTIKILLRKPSRECLSLRTAINCVRTSPFERTDVKWRDKQELKQTENFLFFFPTYINCFPAVYAYVGLG